MLGFFVGLLDCCVESVLVNRVVELNLALFQLFCCVVHLSSKSARANSLPCGYYVFLTSDRDYNIDNIKNQLILPHRIASFYSRAHISTPQEKRKT